MHSNHPHLVKARIKDLHPTQMTVGMAEVVQKSVSWNNLPKGDRRDFLSRHWFPAVKGPKGRMYIVDHHHLGRALMDDEVSECQLVLLKDLSTLELDEFWLVMDHNQWVHPYDAKGKRHPAADIPASLSELTDDPFRSLAAQVRNHGGYPKDSTPFAEFLWADFFRRRIPRKLVNSDPDQALAQALILCHAPEASHLPGWSGVQSPVQVLAG